MARGELNESFFCHHFVIHQRPLVIRNYNLSNWPAQKNWSKQRYIENTTYSDDEAYLGRLPYSQLYGGDRPVGPVSLKTFIEHSSGNDSSENVPLYWFRAIHNKSDPIVQDIESKPAFLESKKFHATPSYWQHFIGGLASGSSAHLHDNAWNALLYGRKRWFIWSPPHSYTSNMPPLEWLIYSNWTETANTFFCTQNENDIILVPSDYAHATLNIMESVGIAGEFRINILL